MGSANLQSMRNIFQNLTKFMEFNFLLRKKGYLALAYAVYADNYNDDLFFSCDCSYIILLFVLEARNWCGVHH